MTVPGGSWGGDLVFLTLSGVGVQVTGLNLLLHLEEVMVIMLEDALLPSVQLRVYRAMGGGWPLPKILKTGLRSLTGQGVQSQGVEAKLAGG